MTRTGPALVRLAQIDAHAAEARREAEALDHDLRSLALKRAVVEASLPPELLAAYDALLESGRTPAAVAVRDGRCSACGAAVAIEQVAPCPGCGRLACPPVTA